MNEFTEKIEKAIADALRKAMDDIPNEVMRGVRDTVARALGFSSNSWGKGWEVDHCNGRQSHIGQLVACVTKDKVAKVIHDESIKFELSEAQMKAVRNEMKNVFMQTFRETIRKKVEAYAVAQAEELAKQMVPDLKEIATNITKSLADPNFGSRELEKLALELHVKKVEGERE